MTPRILSRCLAALVACSCSAACRRRAQPRRAGHDPTTVDAEQQRTIAMLEPWVNQNSGTLNLAGVEAVGGWSRRSSSRSASRSQWIDMKAAGRAGHLVARHTGQGAASACC